MLARMRPVAGSGMRMDETFDCRHQPIGVGSKALPDPTQPAEPR